VEIGREHRYELYDLNLELPKPLVPRHLRFDVPERIAADGSVLRSLDEDFVRRLVAELRDKGIKAIAVSYLNSFRNATHERRTAEIIAGYSDDPGVPVRSGAEIREFCGRARPWRMSMSKSGADYLAQQQRLTPSALELLHHVVQRWHSDTRDRFAISGSPSRIGPCCRRPGRCPGRNSLGSS
jgi:hypothetical protein